MQKKNGKERAAGEEKIELHVYYVRSRKEEGGTGAREATEENLTTTTLTVGNNKK